MNPEKFKSCFNSIRDAEEKARENIENAINEKYIILY